MVFFQLLLICLLLVHLLTFPITSMRNGDAFPFGFPEDALRLDAFEGGRVEELHHDRRRALLAAVLFQVAIT